MTDTKESDTRRAVIITALSVEYNAVRAHLTDLREEVSPHGTVYEVGEVGVPQGGWEVTLIESGMGNTKAALETERALSRHEADVVLFVGIAGGIKDLKVGDVVFASKVYGYESGQETSHGLQPRPDIGRSSYALEQRARSECRARSREPESQGYKTIVKPIAAGEKVLKSRTAQTYKFIRECYSDAVAVEMEGRGMLEAAWAYRSLEVGVVRGISDRLSGKTASDAANGQEQAATHAAEFAIRLLQKLYTSSSQPRLETAKSRLEKQLKLRQGDEGEGGLEGFRLAAIGAFVVNQEKAELVRGALFRQVVVAAIVSLSAIKAVTMSELRSRLEEFLPGEQIPDGQIDAALKSLAKAKECRYSKGAISILPRYAAKMASVLERVDEAISRLQTDVIASCKREHPGLTLSQKEVLRVNLRRGLTVIVRGLGEGDWDDASRKGTVRKTLSEGLPSGVGETAFTALAAHSQRPENAECMAVLIRSYGAAMLWNKDPLGRRWQEAILARSEVVLDTDVVLRLLIRELPFHPAVSRAIRSLASRGFSIRVPDPVAKEVVLHLGRSKRTYDRFRDRLLSMPEAAVKAKVWHAGVSGYYYAVTSGRHEGSLESYLSKYYDQEAPFEFLKHKLEKTVGCALEFFSIDGADVGQSDDDQEVIRATETRLMNRERKRLKADFRDESDMKRRAYEHAVFMLGVAQRNIQRNAAGYLVSSDRVFRWIEGHDTWGNRPKVHLFIGGVVALADILGHGSATDSELVSLVFDPVVAAAAQSIGGEMDSLIELGVVLQRVDIERLEWDLKRDLGEALRVGDSSSDNPRAQLRILERARELGYETDDQVHELLRELSEYRARFEEAQRQVESKTEAVFKVVRAAAGKTKSGRRRVRRVLEKSGFDADLIEQALDV